MKPEEYRHRPTQSLSIEGLKAGRKTKALLEVLFSDRGLHVLYSRASEWGASPDKPDYLGSRVVRVSSVGKVEKITKTHASVIYELFNAGILEVDRETPSPHRRVVLFRLTSQAFANQREINREVFLKKRARVMADEVNQLAATYGLRIDHSPLYGSFRVVREDGQKICDDDYINTNAKGELVRRLNHMSLLEWDDVLYSYSLRLKEM